MGENIFMIFGKSLCDNVSTISANILWKENVSKRNEIENGKSGKRRKYSMGKWAPEIYNNIYTIVDENINYLQNDS